MENNIEITPPQEKDVLGIEQVFYKSWIDTYPSEEHGITRENIEERFKDKFTNEALTKRWEKIKNATDRKILVAKNGDLVVGLIIITQQPDKNRLQAIYILPEYTHKGIGTNLWRAVQQYLDVEKSTIVHVATYNKQAIAFYKKLGFKDNGKRWSDEKFRMDNGSIIPEMELEVLPGQWKVE